MIRNCDVCMKQDWDQRIKHQGKSTVRLFVIENPVWFISHLYGLMAYISRRLELHMSMVEEILSQNISKSTIVTRNWHHWMKFEIRNGETNQISQWHQNVSIECNKYSRCGVQQQKKKQVLWTETYWQQRIQVDEQWTRVYSSYIQVSP